MHRALVPVPATDREAMGKFILFLILVLCVGMAVPRTRTIMEARAKPVVDRLKAKIVPGRLQAMADELNARVMRGEGYPSDWSHWLQRDFTSNPMDPWGHEYYLKHIPDGFEVGSKGPDGVEGTTDDITLRKLLRR
jgi:hypothetical protein